MILNATRKNETNTLFTLPHKPSKALRLTQNKTQPSSPQDILVKQGYVKRGTICNAGIHIQMRDYKNHTVLNRVSV